MSFYADLHVHSRYARATSRNADLVELAWWARRKGITVLGTGDFTHPGWFEELREGLVPAEPGLFRLRDELDRGVVERLPPSCRGGSAHAPPAVRAGAGDGGETHRPPRPQREPRRGRAADPGHGRGRAARGHPRQRGRRLPGAGARLDALGGRAERHRRVRLHRGLLRGAGGPHLRSRDRAVGGPADELAGLPPRPLPVGELLGRARPLQARPGGDRARHRAGLLRDPPGAGGRGGVPGDGGAVPRGGPLLPERPQELRRPPGAGRGAPGRAALPRLRQAADHGGAAAGRGPGRPPGRRPPAGGGRLPQPASPGRARRRGRRGRPHQQDRAADRRRHDRAARAGVAHPGARGGGRHRRGRLPGGGRGDRRGAPRPGHPRPRLRRPVRVYPAVCPRPVRVTVPTPSQGACRMAVDRAGWAEMRAADLQPIFEAPGPFLSLYLAAGGDVENAAQRLEVRWKSARGELQERGVPIGVLEAVDPLVEGGHAAGATLAAVVSVDGAAYHTGLPSPLVREVLIRWGATPYALPLLAHAQSQVSFVAVLASRATAE